MKLRNATRTLILWVLLLVLILTSCVPVPVATHTPSVMPSPTSIVLPTGTSIPPSALMVVGSTAPSETFTTRWAQLEMKTFDGIELATLIDAGGRRWRVVTDEKGQVQIFVNKAGGVILLAQGPPGFQWDRENLLWRGETRDDRKIAIAPDVLLSGGWHEDTQTAGPWAAADKAFLVIDENGNYWVVIHYPSDALQQLPRGDKPTSQGVCPPVIDKSQFAQTLITLADGSGFCVREPIIVILAPRE